MAKLEFIENNKDLRFKRHPENTKVMWYNSENCDVRPSDLIIIVHRYVKCYLGDFICGSCRSGGYELNSKEGKRFCGGWLEERDGGEDSGWWEVTG